MMKNSFDDLDLELEELNGGVESFDKLDEVSTPPIEAEEEDDYQLVLKRLRNYTDKTWIAMPIVEDGKVKILVREVMEATNEEFLNWVEYIWPLTKKSKHTPESYAKKSSREKIVAYIAERHASLEMKGSLDFGTA